MIASLAGRVAEIVGKTKQTCCHKQTDTYHSEASAEKALNKILKAETDYGHRDA